MPNRRHGTFCWPVGNASALGSVRLCVSRLDRRPPGASCHSPLLACTRAQLSVAPVLPVPPEGHLSVTQCVLPSTPLLATLPPSLLCLALIQDGRLDVRARRRCRVVFAGQNNNGYSGVQFDAQGQRREAARRHGRPRVVCCRRRRSIGRLTPPKTSAAANGSL